MLVSTITKSFIIKITVLPLTGSPKQEGKLEPKCRMRLGGRLIGWLYSDFIIYKFKKFILFLFAIKIFFWNNISQIFSYVDKNIFFIISHFYNTRPLILIFII